MLDVEGCLAYICYLRTLGFVCVLWSHDSLPRLCSFSCPFQCWDSMLSTNSTLIIGICDYIENKSLPRRQEWKQVVKHHVGPYISTKRQSKRDRTAQSRCCSKQLNLFRHHSALTSATHQTHDSRPLYFRNLRNSVNELG
jgi:hypothetical protein